MRHDLLGLKAAAQATEYESLPHRDFVVAGFVTRVVLSRHAARIYCPDGLRCSLDSTEQLHALSCDTYYGELGVVRGSVARIMIAEDRESMRTALKAIFVMRPNWVVCGEAQDAKEAVAKAMELRPDLIVMDFKMHHSDGLTAASDILRLMPSIPIVMFTLYKTDELEAAAKMVGVRSVVAKEDGVRTLLGAIDAELQLQNQQPRPDRMESADSV
jgi:CheY-like chemotaxis protein